MFDDKNRFIIEDYNRQTTFASFLPGISGVYGTPIWSFYVNRGQAITSFGAENKDHSIMEFFPAHPAYQNTKQMGFRTFLKLNGSFYEPFSSDTAKTKMYIGMNELEIEEVNEALGFQINVLYYTLPNEELGGLVRTVTVKNISGKSLDLELLDGMPALIPYGVNQDSMKNTTQTIMAWMQAEDVAEGLPYYRVRVSTADTAEVKQISEGNYLVSVDRAGKRLPVLADPELIFAYDTAMSRPVNFMELSLEELLKREQICQNQVPCGFSGMHVSLEAGGDTGIYTVIGQAGSKELFHAFAEKGLNEAFFSQKYMEGNQLIDELADHIGTRTADSVFDAYCKQTYIDNVLRGGYPVEIGENKIFYVYSRKHGDIERDYNFFSMLPEYFSQGNGNFRDVNQNRRCDLFFSPFVKEHNIKVFYNLQQLDGYNPLLVKQVTYEMENVEQVLSPVPADKHEAVRDFFQKEFSPGQLFTFLHKEKIELSLSEPEYLRMVMNHSKEKLNADFGEGYWSDHWTYNLDLVDSYLMVYPEQEEKLLYEDSSYTFYESKAVVLPRTERYVRTEHGVRQYRSVDLELKKETKGDMARKEYGKGDVYQVNLMTKLLLLAVNKFGALDMMGRGVEMEGGKPGWYDALNGLPGLFGSSMCESYELKRMLLFLKEKLEKYDREVLVPEELYAYMEALKEAVDTYNKGGRDRMYVWNQANIAKEAYWKKTAFGIDGAEKSLSPKETAAMLGSWISYMDEGIAAACDQYGGIAPAYCAYSMDDYTEQDGVFTPVNFKNIPLPLFLEGPVRYLKLPGDKAEKTALYEKVKASGMYDKKLSMYKVNESLEKASFELGRAKAFTPGWLENESVWLHMEYKYLLELIKSGLYREYFDDFKKAGVPFLPYETYGRSPLENSSFIASSANPNERIHGKGFVARLSGSTAEFLQMWELMMFGSKLFCLEQGELTLSLEPAIPAYLVPEDGRVCATLFGNIQVIYEAGSSRDLIPGEYQVTGYELTGTDGKTLQVKGQSLSGEDAARVRDGQVSELVVTIM